LKRNNIENTIASIKIRSNIQKGFTFKNGMTIEDVKTALKGITIILKVLYSTFCYAYTGSRKLKIVY